MTDVTNALNAGHEVTISEKQINFKGWTGSGYIIIDPNNGSGAYLISGGANGAVILFTAGATIMLLGAILTVISGGVAGAIGLSAVLLGTAIIAAGIALLAGKNNLCRTILSKATGVFIMAISAFTIKRTSPLPANEQFLFSLEGALVGLGINIGIDVLADAFEYRLFSICDAKD